MNVLGGGVESNVVREEVGGRECGGDCRQVVSRKWLGRKKHTVSDACCMRERESEAPI